MIILIDTGTTNSRIRLVKEEDKVVIGVVKLPIGVRNTAIDGSNERLKQELSKGVAQLLEEHSFTGEDIRYIVAAGMITSNLGLYEVPHVESPAGIEDFIQGAKIVEAEEFFHIPCLYVPGMKNSVTDSLKEDLEVIDQYDVMRGEEVETYGLLEQIPAEGKGIMILPGSHTKYVLVGEDQKLLSCRSTLGGEMLKAVRDQTILSDSLNEKLVDEVDPYYLLKGFEAARKSGVTRSLYQIRLLQLFSDLSENERANYYAGAVLSYDIDALAQMLEEEGVSWVTIGGSEPLRSIFYHLLVQENYPVSIQMADDDQVETAAVYGALEVGRQFVMNL